MAKFIPMDVLKTLYGKICGHSDMYFANRGETKYTGKMCYPRTTPFTATELARQTLFKNAVLSAKAVMAATSSDTDQSNYTKLTAYTAAHAALPTPRGALFNYIMKQEYAILKAAND